MEYTRVDAKKAITEFRIFCRIVAGLKTEKVAKKIMQIPFSRNMGTTLRNLYEIIVNTSDCDMAKAIYQAVYITQYNVGELELNMNDLFDEISLSLKETNPQIADEIQSGIKYIKHICGFYLEESENIHFTELDDYIAGVKKCYPKSEDMGRLSQPDAIAILEQAVVKGIIKKEGERYCMKGKSEVPPKFFRYFVALSIKHLGLDKSNRNWVYFERLFNEPNIKQMSIIKGKGFEHPLAIAVESIFPEELIESVKEEHNGKKFYNSI